MQALLHYITIIPKVIAIAATAEVHKIILWFTCSAVAVGAEPNIDMLRVEYRAVRLGARSELVPAGDGTAILSTNPDHQALRQGALAWSNPRFDIINGMHNYIHDGKFIRGYQNNDLTKPNEMGAPAAMPMSVAHALATALKEGIEITPEFRQKYLEAVDNLMANNMRIDSDTSTELRVASTGFDAIYALSLLYTAYQLSGDSKYTREANKILYVKGYAALLLAPMTWMPGHRNYYVDHISMFGLRTACLMAPNAFVRALLRHAMRFVGEQSYAYANPYFAAMQQECGALPDKQRRKVLAVHASVKILRAANHRGIIYTNRVPSDFSTHTADEFLFDELHGEGIETTEGTIKQVGLNGLCLGRSLAVLMGKTL